METNRNRNRSTCHRPVWGEDPGTGEDCDAQFDQNCEDFGHRTVGTERDEWGAEDGWN